MSKLKAFLTGRTGLFVVVGIAAVGIAVGLVVSSLVGSDGKDEATTTSTSQVAGAAQVERLLEGIPQQGNALGAPDAPVTLVEYADVQCPFCGVFAKDVFPAIVREYVRPGKVRLEFRGMAFIGPDSLRALQAVTAAGLQNRLWNVLDLLFENQGEENSGWVSDGLVRSIGASVTGLDVDAVMEQRESPEVGRQLAEMKSLADASGISATPSFEVGKSGGELMRLDVQALEPAAFRPALDSLLG